MNVYFVVSLEKNCALPCFLAPSSYFLASGKEAMAIGRERTAIQPCLSRTEPLAPLFHLFFASGEALAFVPLPTRHKIDGKQPSFCGDDCKSRFYVQMQLTFFQKKAESFWQPGSGNPHLRQRILAKTSFKALPITLNKRQGDMAILLWNDDKTQKRAPRTMVISGNGQAEKRPAVVDEGGLPGELARC